MVSDPLAMLGVPIGDGKSSLETDKGLNRSLGQQIRSIREKKGLSRADLEEKSGILGARIKILEENDDAIWNLVTIMRLARALDAKVVIKLEENAPIT